jgi:hypothetical protein
VVGTRLIILGLKNYGLAIKKVVLFRILNVQILVSFVLQELEFNISVLLITISNYIVLLLLPLLKVLQTIVLIMNIKTISTAEIRLFIQFIIKQKLQGKILVVLC